MPIFLDDTLGLAVNGYAWLPERRRHGDGPVRLRVGGQRAVVIRGPGAVRFFYDEANVHRRTALPEPVVGTLFGRGAVHTLDGAAHRHRKAMFLGLLKDPRGVADLTASVATAWDDEVAGWPGRGRVVLFDEAARIITRGVTAWAGIPLRPDRTDDLAADLVAMVDGFATAGPRHLRARLARGRSERRFEQLVRLVRAGDIGPRGRALAVVAAATDADGTPLPPRTAAVELLNVVRPTVAVAWFVAFAAHALHRWPVTRERLLTGSPAYERAFADEVRRFYPFAPFLGGRAVRDLTWEGVPIPAGALVLLDVFGQNHDAALWPEPYRFDPDRFLGREPDPYRLVPQGGGDPAAGHRCPGEDVTLQLIGTLAARLAGLGHHLPAQDLSIALHRIPARVRSGVVLEAGPAVSAPAGRVGGAAR